MSKLLYFDQLLFYYVNQVFAWPLMDPVMAVLSAKASAFMMIALALAATAWWRRWRAFTVFCFLLVAVGVADYTAFNILKPLAGRIRPCHIAPELVRTAYGCGGRFSFPSNHATNLAVVSFYLLRYFGWKAGATAAFVALLVGLSRISLGVHYPLDILSGYLYGLLIAWCILRLGRWFMVAYFPGHQATNYLKLGAERK